jgi:hypothetical protein
LVPNTAASVTATYQRQVVHADIYQRRVIQCPLLDDHGGQSPVVRDAEDLV